MAYCDTQSRNAVTQKTVRDDPLNDTEVSMPSSGDYSWLLDDDLTVYEGK
jgi:hypothetical protein